MTPTRRVLAATILGSSMAFIDGTVVNVVLPVLQTQLDATVSQVQWVVEAYALFLAALLLVGGSLGDRLGRKRIFALGVAIFALASAACGLAASIGWLIAARAVQGVGAALLVPVSLALLSASFDDANRGKAIGTWSAFTAITAGIGPVLGGWLVEQFSWRWIFFLNLPIAVAAVLLLARVPEQRDERSRRLDPPGAILATLGLGGVVLALIESPRLGWSSALVLGGMVLGLLGLVAFLLVERRREEPMVELGLFSNRDFTGANLLTLLLYGALSGTLFFLPFNLIQIQGYSPTEAGAAFLPFIVLMFFLSRFAGRLADRWGPRPLLIAGPLVAGTGLALLALPGIGSSYWTTFFPGIAVLGLGMATTVAPLTTTVMGAVAQRQAGIASGINNAVSRTASLLSVALFGPVMVALFAGFLDRGLAAAGIGPGLRDTMHDQAVHLAAMTVPPGVDEATTAILHREISTAFVGGFRMVMLGAAAMAGASALIAGLLIGRAAGEENST